MPFRRAPSRAGTRLRQPQDKTSGKYVVKRLLLLGESRKDVTHQERQFGNFPTEITKRSTPERDPPPGQVSDVQSEHSLARGSLPRGCLKKGIVDPHYQKQKEEPRQCRAWQRHNRWGVSERKEQKLGGETGKKHPKKKKKKQGYK